ncbi:MAG: hypothetical protein U1E61_06910 [Bradyrhizobium sp.]
MSIAPPVVRGAISKDYRGRISYRTETFSHEGRRPAGFPDVVKLADQKLAQALAHPHNTGFSLHRTRWMLKENLST